MSVKKSECRKECFSKIEIFVSRDWLAGLHKTLLKSENSQRETGDHIGLYSLRENIELPKKA